MPPSFLRNSSRPTFPAHRPSDEALDSDETLVVGFRLRPDDDRLEAARQLISEHSRQLPHARRRLGHAEIGDHFGVGERIFDRISKGLEELGLKVLRRNRDEGEIYVEAPLHLVEKALDIEFYSVERDGRSHRTFDGPVHLPKALSSRVEQVSGLDSVPILTPRSNCRPVTGDQYQVRQVAELYDFPLEQRGAGQTAVILMLGGGYHQQDLDDYFASIGVPRPEIVDDCIHGATNQPASSATLRSLFESQGFEVAPAPGHDEPEGGSQDLTSAVWTLEATTDVEILGSLLPEARIVVIFAPNTQDDQAAAMQRALSADFAQKYGQPSVISCSWGQYEYTMRDSSRDLMEAHLQKATALGVTVCCSSGDVGGGFVYYPAASQYVLACGGTRIVSLPDEASGKPLLENVWRERRLDQYFSASGGGLSSAFAAPTWQAEAVKPWGGGQRGIPDVAGLASLENGYSLIIGGVQVGVGGTSAVAPLMAGMVGQINGLNADLADDYRVGWLTPLLYGSTFSSAFQPVEEGSNGLYCSNGHWDPCTGLGRPIGSRLAALLRSDGAATSKQASAGD